MMRKTKMNTSTTASMIDGKIENAVDHAAIRAHDAVDRAVASVNPMVERVSAAAQDTVTRVQSTAQTVLHVPDQCMNDVRLQVRERPLASLGLVALAVWVASRFWPR